MFIVRICSICRHDFGLYFICPNCNYLNDFATARIPTVLCHRCLRDHPVPIKVSEQPEQQEELTLRIYWIRPGVQIYEIDPRTELIESVYLIDRLTILLSNNIVTDFRYHGYLTGCRYCRSTPANFNSSGIPWEGEYGSIFECLVEEEENEDQIRILYQTVPLLKSRLPVTQRWIPDNHRPEIWLTKLRHEVRRLIDRRLTSLTPFGLIKYNPEFSTRLENRLIESL